MFHLNACFVSASIYKLQLVDICALQPSIGTTYLSQLLDRHAQLGDANWVFKKSWNHGFFQDSWKITVGHSLCCTIITIKCVIPSIEITSIFFLLERIKNLYEKSFKTSFLCLSLLLINLVLKRYLIFIRMVSWFYPKFKLLFLRDDRTYKY